MMLYHNGTAHLLLLLLLCLHVLHQAQDCQLSEHSVHLQPQRVTCSLGEDSYQDLVHLLAVIQRLRSHLLQQHEKLESERQRGDQLLALISDRKFVCLRSSDRLQVVGHGLQLAKELENEKERGLQLAKQLENEKKHALQLAEELEVKNKQELELFEKLESEKEQNLQLTLKLLAKREYDLEMAENLQKEKQLMSNLIKKLNEDIKSRLDLAKSLEKEMGHYLMQLATVLEIENRVKLTESLAEVRNRCFKTSIDLEKERDKFIDLTTDLERQKQHRLLLAERRRRGATHRAGRSRQLGDQQSAEMHLCALVVELLLEKEKNRCVELELRLQKERLRAAELEHR